MRCALTILSLLIGGAACREPVVGASSDLRLALPGSFGTLDGTDASGYGIWAEDLLYETLLTVGTDGALRPRLASRWEPAGPGQLRVWLRPGATFSDGAPADPKTVAEALETTDLRGKADGESLVITSKNPGLPPELVATMTNVLRPTPGGPAGTGAFAISSREATRAVLRRRAAAPPGAVEAVHVTAYHSGREALAHVLRGDEDLLPQIDGRSAEFFAGMPRLQVVRAPNPLTVLINFGKGLDRETRRALARALPLNEIGHAAFGDGCRPWHHRLPSAPLPPGPPLEILTHAEDPEYVRAALAIRRALGGRGGEVRKVSANEIARKITTGEGDLLLGSATTWPEGMLALQLHSAAGATNVLRYSNPAVDAAFEAGDAGRALAALDEDPPLLLVCSRERLGVVTTRVRNPQLGPWGALESLESWELAR